MSERDRGSGTVLALALVGVVLVLALGLGAVLTAQIGRGRAQAAADLAALAGAGTALAGGDAPCAEAREVARRNGAVLDQCYEEQGSLRVHARIDLSVGQAGAWARAGPASARSVMTSFLTGRPRHRHTSFT